jgi:Skp family chaperone for outer membrane proteins
MSRYASSAVWAVAVLIWPLTYITAATTHTGSAKATEGVIRPYIIVHGHSMSGSWEQNEVSSNELREQFGDRFAWFRKGGDGHEYVVTDSAVMDELDRAMEPQKNINRMQAGVNREQQRVNEMQAGVNAHQREINAMQTQVNEHQPSVDQRMVNRKQSDVNAEQSDVNAEQTKVNARQEKVNEEQRRVSDEFSRRVQEIFNSALQHGVATKLR